MGLLRTILFVRTCPKYKVMTVKSDGEKKKKNVIDPVDSLEICIVKMHKFPDLDDK